MSVLAYILVSVLIVSLVSFIGVITLVVKPKILKKILFALVSFAAGAMLATAFLNLIPEAIKHSVDGVFGFVLLGIVVFFIMETMLYWYHCHGGRCTHHISHAHMHTRQAKVKMPFAYLNLFGDGIHNFLDGLIIAGAYIAGFAADGSPWLGIITTLAVVIHELPQEIGDFGILVYGGFTRLQALLFNFLSALTAVAGAVIGYFFAITMENFTQWLIPFAAGGFIYIAAVDLLPELHQTTRFKRAITQLAFFLLGIGVIWAFTEFIPR